VREQRDLDIEWKFFSLAAVNELDPARYAPLRVAALARREGGNHAVDLAYLALGRMFHERRERYETVDEFAPMARVALPEVGLDPDLVQRALEDESTLEDVLVEHREAVEKLGAFGVPWLLPDDGTSGFFGPVVGERLRGEQALELWDHFIWISAQPSLYELKRGRANLPKLQGLSEEFVPVTEPAGSRG
jgi:2-hydroxychromene-2-carboxylate isomerase